MTYGLCHLIISVHLDLLRYKLTNKLHFDTDNLCRVKQWYWPFFQLLISPLTAFILENFLVSESAYLSYFYFYNSGLSTKLCYRNWADFSLGLSPAIGSSYVEWSGSCGAFVLLVFLFGQHPVVSGFCHLLQLIWQLMRMGNGSYLFLDYAWTKDYQFCSV